MIGDPAIIGQGNGIGERDSGQACAESPCIEAQNRDAGAIVVEVLVQEQIACQLELVLLRSASNLDRVIAYPTRCDA